MSRILFDLLEFPWISLNSRFLRNAWPTDGTTNKASCRVAFRNWKVYGMTRICLRMEWKEKGAEEQRPINSFLLWCAKHGKLSSQWRCKETNLKNSPQRPRWQWSRRSVVVTLSDCQEKGTKRSQRIITIDNYELRNFVRLSACLFACLSACLAVCLSIFLSIFLVAKSNSIRGFVCPLVRPSVRGSVRRSRVSQKQQIRVNSTKITTFCNCWPGDGLVSSFCVILPHFFSVFSLLFCKGASKGARPC